MKKLSAFFWQLVVHINLIYSAPSGEKNDDVILLQENNPWNGTEYSFRFKTLNGLFRSEKGKLKTSDNGIPFIEILGIYVYPDANGDFTSVIYKGNDNGYESNILSNALEKQSTSHLDNYNESDLSKAMQPYDEEAPLGNRIGADVALSLLG